MYDAVFSQTIIGLSQILLISSAISFVMHNARQSLIPGYILTGIIIGPYCFDIVSSSGIATLETLGKIGIMLLLFVAGLEIDLYELINGSKSALPIFLGEVISSVIICSILGSVLALEYSAIALWSFVLILSSTATALKTIKNTNSSTKSYAIYAVSILIIQDIFFSSMQLILSSMSSERSIFTIIYNIFTGVLSPCIPIFGLFYILRFIEIDKNLHVKATHDQNISGLLALCFSVATLCDAISLSMEYGSFFGGLLCGALSNRHEAERIVEPVVKLFSTIFFTWVGLTTNLVFIMDYSLLIISVLFLIHVFKIITNVTLLYAITHDKASLQGGLLLMALSEFSFALITAYHHDDFHSKLLQSLIVISMFTSSFWVNFFTKHKESIIILNHTQEDSV